MLSLAKKKLDKIFINANAGTPYPKNFKAVAVISTSFREKDPYPNNELTISLEANIIWLVVLSLCWLAFLIP